MAVDFTLTTASGLRKATWTGTGTQAIVDQVAEDAGRYWYDSISALAIRNGGDVKIPWASLTAVQKKRVVARAIRFLFKSAAAALHVPSAVDAARAQAESELETLYGIPED